MFTISVSNVLMSNNTIFPVLLNSGTDIIFILLPLRSNSLVPKSGWFPTAYMCGHSASKKGSSSL